jgi:succinate-acetate transporter protein
MSQIPLQENAPWLSLILHSTQHTRHSKVNLARIFTCLIAYLFVFYIYTLYLFVYILKKYLSIPDMLPHYHITYKDIILPSVLI